MTIIFKSDTRLSAPRSRPLVLPNVPISGIKHRWNANTITSKVGEPITKLSDSVGTIDLTTVTGRPVLRAAANGQRYLDLNAEGASGNSIHTTVDIPYQDYSLVMLYYWDVVPTTNINVFSTRSLNATADGLNVIGSRYGVGTYTTGGTSVSTSDPSYSAGWHTVAVGYSPTGYELASVDGNVGSRAQGHKTDPAANIAMFGVRGISAINSKMVEAMYIDHVLSDEELKIVHNELIKQVPK